jgi:deazaflavin-dependent oxidoreductase (nitroreductase family)
MTLSGKYEPSAQEWVREQVETIESSGGTEGTTLKGVPVVVVTSIGARSGKLRKNPVMRVEHDGSYALIASKGGAPEHPEWYHNVISHPVVELQDERLRRDFDVRMAKGAEREEWWQRAVEVWPAYAEYQKKTDREIPVFVAEPA